jgi:MscS family membrane protein
MITVHMPKLKPILLAFLCTTIFLLAETSGKAQQNTNTKFSSPKSTLRTFLTAVNDVRKGDSDQIAEAANCLDLSGIDILVRDQQAPNLVAKLAFIIDRIPEFNPENAPSYQQGPPYTLFTNVRGNIEIVRTDSGEWKFSKSTVNAIPILQQLVDNWPVTHSYDSGYALSIAEWLRETIPDVLRGRGVLLEPWQWIGIVIILIVGVIIGSLAKRIVAPLVVRILHALGINIKFEQVKHNLTPVGLFFSAIFWWMALSILSLPTEVDLVVAVALRFVIAVAAIWSFFKVIDVISEVLEQRAESGETRYDRLLVPFVRKALKFAIFCFGVILLLDNLHVNVTSLIAGVGIGGIAIAVAAQDTLKNLFGSIAILTDRPFRVGDWVRIDGIDGTVVDMNFRTTKIRTFDDSVVTLPNSKLLDTAVDNWGLRSYRRWKTTLSLEYSTPPDKIDAFCAGIRELINQNPNTRKDRYFVYANEFADSSINVLLYMYFHVVDYEAELEARHDFLLDIVRLSEKIGVSFAFPTRTVHIVDAKETHC